MKSAIKRLVRFLLSRPRGVRLSSGAYLRRPWTIYGARCISLGKNSYILSHAYLNAVQKYAGISYSPHIEIGQNVYIGRYVYLTAVDHIRIGDGSVLSEHVYITDLLHGMDPDRGPIMQQPLESKGPVVIGANCFLGYRSVVTAGVTLGNHCIVGANSVVTKSFADFSMIAGSPARLIKRYSPESKQWQSIPKESRLQKGF